MNYAAIRAIEYYLPSNILSNDELALNYPDFPADKIMEKTGIMQRHISASDEFASDMAVNAARKLFENNKIKIEEIDFLIFCTQTADYLLPTSACVIQNKLGLKKSVGAIDVNLGCSGFVYGLSLAKGLIESNQAKHVLLLTADTYTKLLEPSDKSVRTIFGDGAAASLISVVDYHQPCITPVMFGTDGLGAKNLCVQGRGMRNFDNQNADPYLRMDGREIFNFTLDAVPKLVTSLLTREKQTISDINLFVFHQANSFMLNHLKRKIGIPDEKFFISMDFCGNTVSSTIPIALKEAYPINQYNNVMLVGFGVGYSWAASIVNCEFML